MVDTFRLKYFKTVFQASNSGTYETGDFEAVKHCITEHILAEEKAVSMNKLHQIYDLSSGDCRYRNKLKNKIQNSFPDKLCFLVPSVNVAEVVISKTVFENAIHHSLDPDSVIRKTASVLRNDIVDYC